MGRDPKDVIIVDNSPSAYLFQPENAFPIESWFINKEDTQLKLYIPVLKGLAVTNDVRDHLKKFIKKNKVYLKKGYSCFGIEMEKRHGIQKKPDAKISHKRKKSLELTEE